MTKQKIILIQKNMATKETKNTPPEIVPNNTQPEPKKSSCLKTGLIVLGALAAFVIIIIIIALWATSGIADVANKQLEALRKGDIATAYSLTSNQFQTSTSLTDFTAFVNKYPALKNNISANFTERSNENNLGKLVGKLTANDGTVSPIEYNLVKENDQWKILNINLNPSGATTNQPTSNGGPATSTGTKIVDIKASDVVNSQGHVAAGKTVFATNTNEIAVSVYISDAVAGQTVSAQMRYAGTGETTNIVSNNVSESGDIVSNFSFSKPPSGWPVGDYAVRIATDSGETKDLSFKVQ